MINESWSKISLTFFCIIAIFGTIMRLTPFTKIFIAYEHILHAHSHVAFQGWIYTALFLLITKLYLSNKLIKQGKYKLQFILTLIVILGIMFSFIFQGYAFYSILFSSLFQVLNYWFIYRFFKDVKKNKSILKHHFSLQFIKVGLIMLALSTVGPWAVGVLSAKGFAGSEYFNAALYFFLHFQYNGWFTFAIIGLFFWMLEHYQIKFKLKQAKISFLLFSFSIIPAYTLSLLGMSFRNYFIAIGFLAAILQLSALTYLVIAVISSLKNIQLAINNCSLLLLIFVGISFTLKTILQLLSVFPVFEKLAFENRFLIIDFIHLVMIGFISFFILAIFLQIEYLKRTIYSKIGTLSLIAGFVASELILLGLGLNLPITSGQIALLIASGMMAIGVILVFTGQQTKPKYPA